MTPRSPFRRSLAVRIVTPLAVALVGVFAVGGAYLAHVVRGEGLRELGERGRLLADTLAVSAELPLLARDADALRVLLEGAGREPDVIEASVFDARGRELARFAPQGRPSLAGAADADFLVVERPVRTASLAGGPEASAFAMDPAAATESADVGRVRVFVSTKSTADRTRKLLGTIAGAAAGLLATCLLAGFAIARVVSRPLRALVAAARRIAAGDLSVRVAPSSPDEVGELAAAFNGMAQDLEVARAEVQAEREELERRVVERTAKLERAQETLVHSEKMSAIGQLVAGVAHELNNPLTVVLGYAEMLRQRLTDPTQLRQVETLTSAAETTRAIVQNLLAFARKQKSARAPTDLNEVVRRTINLRAYHLRSAEIEAELDLAPELPRIHADFHQLQQVVLNLLVNAEQAMQDSGRGNRIRFATRVEGVRVALTVRDEGPGMPPEVQSRIFEPFFTTKEVGRGTGLGLSICYGIVTEHGGEIDLRSAPGEGTEFTLRFPIERRRAADAPPVESVARSEAAGAGRRLRVLVIDDDPAILRFVEDAFRDAAVAIVAAHGGREALELLARDRAFDAILSDLRMPEVDGRAVYRFLDERCSELLPRLAFFSGDVANPESIDFLERSGRPVLSKPFTIGSLREAIDAIAAPPARR